MEALLGARHEEGSGGRQLRVDIAGHLQNAYGIAHGAATAALLASAVRHRFADELAAGQSGDAPAIAEMSVSYQSPVPGGWTVDVVVDPGPAALAGGAAACRRVVAELQVSGKALARGTFQVRLPAPAPAVAPRADRPRGVAPRAGFGGLGGLASLRFPLPSRPKSLAAARVEAAEDSSSSAESPDELGDAGTSDSLGRETTAEDAAGGQDEVAAQGPDQVAAQAGLAHAGGEARGGTAEGTPRASE